jgi:succinyl-CoA synthetase beta subunit
MNIHEFQAKRLLKQAGIRVPRGELARTPDEAREIADRLQGDAWMVKAQVRAGGRGLGKMPDGKGGIRRAGSLDEVAEHATQMLGNALVTAQTGSAGLEVKSVYIEQVNEAEREFGLSLVVDERKKGIVLLVTEAGGTEIESMAEKPGSVHVLDVDQASGVAEDRLSQVLIKTGLDDNAASNLKQVIKRLVRFFCSKDASLLEINPIALDDGEWIALDAKMAFDRNALYRQDDIFAIEREDDVSDAQKLASTDGFNYIVMDGNISSIAVGAGLSMATLDAIKYCGGEPANFLDLPPDSRVNRLISALELVLSNPRTTSLIINVFGGGIMRCDTVSDAITLVHRSQGIEIPLTVRLAGTNSELANRRLRETMPHVHLASNMAEAAQYAVDAANQEPGRGGVPDKPSLLSRVKSVFNSGKL